MSTVKINPVQIHESIRNIDFLAKTVLGENGNSWKSSSLVGFTRVSGLDQLGREHAGVLDTGPGSARVVAQGLGEVIGGLARGLQATVHRLEAQEEVFARALDR